MFETFFNKNKTSLRRDSRLNLIYGELKIPKKTSHVPHVIIKNLEYFLKSTYTPKTIGNKPNIE